jgi:hypothetical protein
VGLVVVGVHVLVVVATQPHRLGALEQLHPPARRPRPAASRARAPAVGVSWRDADGGRPAAAAAVVSSGSCAAPRGPGILGHATGAPELVRRDGLTTVSSSWPAGSVCMR